MFLRNYTTLQLYYFAIILLRNFLFDKRKEPIASTTGSFVLCCMWSLHRGMTI